MSGTDLVNAYEYSSGRALDVIGIFHSHIYGIRPSKKDIRFMEINPVIWLIYSVSDFRFGAYIIEDSIKEVSIKVIKD
jgi:proteasome lid subunit RPN8/RPN11